MSKRSKFAPTAERTEEAGYLGPAGEHLVLAKLLLLQFDAAIVSRDNGNDIIALKGQKHFRVQVKARTLRGAKADRAVIYVNRNVLERRDQADYYVYVMFPHRKGQESYIVVPGRKVRNWTQDGTLPYRQNQDRYQSNIITQQGRWFVKNLEPKNEITDYVDAWYQLSR